MGTFLKLLELELNSLDQNDLHEPEADVEPKDNVVGVMSDESIRLFTLWRQAQKSHAEKMMELRFGQASGDKGTLHSQLHELDDKQEVLERLFWYQIKDEYNLWDKSVGVRTGRKVVWFDYEGPNLKGFLNL